MITKSMLFNGILCGLVCTASITFGMDNEPNDFTSLSKAAQPSTTLFIPSKNNLHFYEIIKGSSDNIPLPAFIGVQPEKINSQQYVPLTLKNFDQTTIDVIKAYNKQNVEVFVCSSYNRETDICELIRIKEATQQLKKSPTEIASNITSSLKKSLNNQKISSSNNDSYLLGGSVILGIMLLIVAYQYNLKLSQLCKNLRITLSAA